MFDFPLKSSWHCSVLTVNFENLKHGHTRCSLPFSSQRFQLWTSVVYKCSAWRLPDLFCIFDFKAKAARKPSEFHAGISWTLCSPADNCYSDLKHGLEIASSSPTLFTFHPRKGSPKIFWGCYINRHVRRWAPLEQMTWCKSLGGQVAGARCWQGPPGPGGRCSLPTRMLSSNCSGRGLQFIR